MLIYYYLVFLWISWNKKIFVCQWRIWVSGPPFSMASSEMIFHWLWYDGFALIIQTVCMLSLLTRQLPVWHPHPTPTQKKKKSIKKFTLLESSNCCHHLGKLPVQELAQNQTQASGKSPSMWAVNDFLLLHTLAGSWEICFLSWTVLLPLGWAEDHHRIYF